MSEKEKPQPMDKEERAEYNLLRKMIGEYRVQLLTIEYEEQGYKVTAYPVEAKGLDMIAENDSEVLGIESTNWNEKGYLNPDRLGEMIANWNEKESELKQKGDKRNYRRILVYSYRANIEANISSLHEANVELRETGSQWVPPELERDDNAKRWRLKGWID